jgi:hypothetical protein
MRARRVREATIFCKGWKFAVVAGWMATVATPALSQGLDRRADLNSPQSGHADPGDLVMDLNVTEALPNAFGKPSIFGRRRPAGRTVVQYVGTENGTVYFSRQSAAISSNETTMTRTPIFIPHPSGNIIIPLVLTLNRRLGLRPLRLASRSAACCMLKDTRSAFCGSIVTVRLTSPSLRVLRVNSGHRCRPTSEFGGNADRAEMADLKPCNSKRADRRYVTSGT